jgi:hypothetical protein
VETLTGVEASAPPLLAPGDTCVSLPQPTSPKTTNDAILLFGLFKGPLLKVSIL